MTSHAPFRQKMILAVISGMMMAATIPVLSACAAESSTIAPAGPEPVIDLVNLPKTESMMNVRSSQALNEDEKKILATTNAFSNYAAYNHDYNMAAKLAAIPFSANGVQLSDISEVKKFLETLFPVGKQNAKMIYATVISRKDFDEAIKEENPKVREKTKFFDQFNENPEWHYVVLGTLDPEQKDPNDLRNLYLRDIAFFTRKVGNKTLVTGVYENFFESKKTP